MTFKCTRVEAQSHPPLNNNYKYIETFDLLFWGENRVFVDLRLLLRRNVGGRTPLTKGIKELVAAKTVKISIVTEKATQL